MTLIPAHDAFAVFHSMAGGSGTFFVEPVIAWEIGAQGVPVLPRVFNKPGLPGDDSVVLLGVVIGDRAYRADGSLYDTWTVPPKTVREVLTEIDAQQRAAVEHEKDRVAKGFQPMEPAGFFQEMRKLHGVAHAWANVLPMS